ncbi:MAG: DNA polymerase III subunit alpha [Desulfovibrionaceae bacterium]
MSSFVHLHCHTEYSLLDGAIRINDLCQKTVDNNMPAAAITDHGNLYGAMNFYLACKKYGIKPIIGCEIYVANDHLDKTSDVAKRRHHLILLAKNKQGYHNLLRIVSESALYGFHYKPRADKKILEKYSEGLIALSACYGGEIPRVIREHGLDAGIKMSREYANIFPNNFYLEVQSNGMEEQKALNASLYEIAEHTGLPLVATNDCHYLNADDVEAHDVLLCIQTQALVSDTNRMRFNTTELFYKTPQEMQDGFLDRKDVLENTLAIAEQCNVEFEFGKYHFPLYSLSENRTAEEEFRYLSKEGLKKRLTIYEGQEPIDEVLYWARLEEELDIICNMGFAGYFLIVQDFINWAKSSNIPVGPGRGSAAGSLVAWALRITNIDPIPYNLLFERFLNSERISMPDIDVDFCERRRGEVIEYVSKKYGEESVAQITTFGTMKAKGAVRDIGRALGMSFSETNVIAKLIPDELKMTLDKAMEQEPQLQELYKSNKEIKKLLDIARKLEGLSRHASTHAAGLVISDKMMQEYLPLYKGKKGEIVTQYDMKIVEKIGLVKFDFLGLKTMTVIEDTLCCLERQGKEKIDLERLNLKDEKTYSLYSSGDTDGIFQVESGGMRQYLRMLQPSCFEDIIAMLALYRPGPLKTGMVDEFIKRKHGFIPITYPLPELEQCLKETYGVIVYQEQVMQIVQIVARYSLGAADILRRAMGKKDVEEMAKQRAVFIEGARLNGIGEGKAEEIFQLIETFAEYGFNKSHSAAYALISYYTAYLRSHYPIEFMAALFSADIDNKEKLLKYISQSRYNGIEILPPCIIKSEEGFSVQDGKIIFALGAIKNVGSEAIHEIISAREKKAFSSLYDMCTRVNLRKVTRRVFEQLIKAGACDCFGMPRRALLAALEQCIAKAQKTNKTNNSSQNNFFSLIPELEEITVAGIGYSCEEESLAEFDEKEFLFEEKSVIGFFLSRHPLQALYQEYNRLSLHTLEELKESSTSSQVSVGVIVTDSKEIVTKKGEIMAFITVEDLTGSLECVIFPKVYAIAKELLKENVPLVITGTIDCVEQEQFRTVKLITDKIERFIDVSKENNEIVEIKIPNTVRKEQIKALQEILSGSRGHIPVMLSLSLEETECVFPLSDVWHIVPSNEFFTKLSFWNSQH